MVAGPVARIFGALLLGPLISRAGSRKMGLLMAWMPRTKEGVAFPKELIEAGTVAPAIDRRYPRVEVPEALRYLEAGDARATSSLRCDAPGPTGVPCGEGQGVT